MNNYFAVGQMHHFEIFVITKYCNLETRVMDHSGTLKMTQVARSYMT